MNIFGSKKEAWIIAGVTAFFVLVALAFTLEPLVTIILSTRALPAGTTVTLKIPEKTAPNEVIGEITNLIKDFGFKEPNQNIMTKVSALAASLPIQGTIALASSSKGLPYSLVIETASKPEDIITAIRQLVARLTPSELITILPDNTTMIEIVIDPGMVTVTNQNGQWLFAKLNPQINIQEKPLGSAILINNPQVVEIHGFEAPLSCRLTQTKIREVTYNSQRQALLPAIFNGFLAYFRHYSCFQSFSTLDH
jgi:hypothetical protein